MLSFEEMEYHPTSEKLVEILQEQNRTDDALFFRVLSSYYFSLAAAQMRCTIISEDRGRVPVNMYALNLAPSGFGKTKACRWFTNNVLGLFRQRFINETFQLLAEDNIPKLANTRAVRKGTDPDDELKGLEKEFKGLGEMYFSFNSGTAPAVRQMRRKLLIANAGSLNLVMDEVGNNLVSNEEVFDAFIELFDQGEIDEKLLKNSAENARTEEVKGTTPTNLLMFGVPSRLLDGAKSEELLMKMLDNGYARRCFFGYIRSSERAVKTASEMYDAAVQQHTSQVVQELSMRFEHLADMVNVNKQIRLERAQSILLYEYQLACETIANKLPEHQIVRKQEIANRFWKVLKLAGAYAFIDDSPAITDSHLYAAIKLAEDSSRAFDMLLSRDKPWVKLAKYIGAVGTDVTQADLAEDLPFYKGGISAKNEMLTQATAWGYKNNIIIKKSFSDGIEFLRGETLKETDLAKMVLSYSTDITTDYRNETAPFDQLHKLTQAPGMHWVAHHLNGGYRNEENCIPGFNLVVIDVDGGVNLSTAKLLLKNYKFLLYTTKRHTETEHRFRIILPINYELAMDAKDYKEFMSNIYEWLPFDVDNATNQRARKWLSHDGHYEYNEGEVLDALPFIPKTSKNEERKNLLNSQQSMDNLERWLLNQANEGGRNNMLHRFAMTLVDAGFSFDAIRNKIMEFNAKLPDKLDEAEILSTVLTTVAKKLAKGA